MERKSPAAQLALSKENALSLITAALKEDIGSKDLTTSVLIPKGRTCEAELVVRKEGVVAGLGVAEWVFHAVDPKIRFKPAVCDGDRVYPDKVLAYIEGPAQGLLAAERTCLNFLSHLSGIATLTRAFVERIKKYRVQILATRKTLPTLRLLEKYAVTVGGGRTHRMGLYDEILIKDNHLRLIKGRYAIENAVKQARLGLPKGASIEVEVKNLQEFRQCLGAGVEVILLDNMRLPEIQEALRIRNAVFRTKKNEKPLLEISGGVTLENVEAIAACGVDRISVGAITHSAPALDISLEVVG